MYHSTLGLRVIKKRRKHLEAVGGAPVGEVVEADHVPGDVGVTDYRGTSLIRNCPPP